MYQPWTIDDGLDKQARAIVAEFSYLSEANRKEAVREAYWGLAIYGKTADAIREYIKANYPNYW